MPFHRIPGSEVEFALIGFDDDGKERTDDPAGGVFSRTILDRITQVQPTHVFLFSHGWKGDVPSAIDQYNRWISAMWKMETDREALGSGFRPMFIGLHWPSQPWGEEALPVAVSIATAGASAIAPLVDAAVRHFGGGDALRKPLETIFAAYEQNPAARILPDDVLDAYAALGAAIGFTAGGGPDAAPDEDGAPLDPSAAVRAERAASLGESFGLFGNIRNGILAGLRQASFWTMKRRARSIGEGGMHTFVADLQRASDANIHLMGHSFGCIVMSSILGGPKGQGGLPRPVNSAALVQGALSHWSYAEKIPHAGDNRPGYFAGILNRQAISGPLLTTQSIHDTAVGVAYPAAVSLINEFAFGTATAAPPKFGAMGTFGIQGRTATGIAMLDANGSYGFQPGQIYNVESSPFVPDHSGIDGPEMAHLLWQAVAARGGTQ
jgi:hypothetical protein